MKTIITNSCIFQHSLINNILKNSQVLQKIGTWKSWTIKQNQIYVIEDLKSLQNNRLEHYMNN